MAPSPGRRKQERIHDDPWLLAAFLAAAAAGSVAALTHDWSSEPRPSPISGSQARDAPDRRRDATGRLPPGRRGRCDRRAGSGRHPRAGRARRRRWGRRRARGGAAADARRHRGLAPGVRPGRVGATPCPAHRAPAGGRRLQRRRSRLPLQRRVLPRARLHGRRRRLRHVRSLRGIATDPHGPGSVGLSGLQPADRVLRGAGSGHGPQVAPRERPAIGVGDAQLREPPPRPAVLDDHGLVAAPEDPLVGPLAQGGQDGQQRLALLAEAVLEAVSDAARRPPARGFRGRPGAAGAPTGCSSRSRGCARSPRSGAPRRRRRERSAESTSRPAPRAPGRSRSSCRQKRFRPMARQVYRGILVA